MTHRRTPFLLLPVLVALLAVLLAAAPSARADDEADARKSFRAEMKHQNWKVRSTAFALLLDFDSAKTFEEAFSAVLKDESDAVKLAGIKALGEFESEGAKKTLLAELKRAKGEKAAILLMALAEQKGESDGLQAVLHDYSGG